MKIRILKEMVSKAIVTRGGKILLLKRADKYITEKNYWTWDIPGGHVESGESPEGVNSENLEKYREGVGQMYYKMILKAL